MVNNYADSNLAIWVQFLLLIIYTDIELRHVIKDTALKERKEKEVRHIAFNYF